MTTHGVGIGNTDPKALLDVSDGTSTPTEAGPNDVYIQHNLEVDGAIYGDGSHLTGIQAGVTSFNGREGAVDPVSGDYTASEISGLANASINLGGDLSGTTTSATVSTIGGKAITAADTPNTIVERDSSGNFSAGTITATLSGTATNFSGSLTGDVTGTQGATVVGHVGGLTASTIATAISGLGTAASQNTSAFLQPGNNLSDVSSASTSAHHLGLGTADSPTFTGLTISGSSATLNSKQIATALIPVSPVVFSASPYSATAFSFVPVDTTSGNVVVTLPNGPADQTIIAVKMTAQASTNTVTINTQGSDVFNKSGGGTSLTLSLAAQGVLLQYSHSTSIWYVVGDDLPLSQLVQASSCVAPDYPWTPQDLPGAVVWIPNAYSSNLFVQPDSTASLLTNAAVAGDTVGIINEPCTGLYINGYSGSLPTLYSGGQQLSGLTFSSSGSGTPLFMRNVQKYLGFLISQNSDWTIGFKLLAPTLAVGTILDSNANSGGTAGINISIVNSGSNYGIQAYVGCGTGYGLDGGANGTNYNTTTLTNSSYLLANAPNWCIISCASSQVYGNNSLGGNFYTTFSGGGNTVTSGATGSIQIAGSSGVPPLNNAGQTLVGSGSTTSGAMFLDLYWQAATGAGHYNYAIKNLAINGNPSFSGGNWTISFNNNTNGPGGSGTFTTGYSDQPGWTPQLPMNGTVVVVSSPTITINLNGTTTSFPYNSGLPTGSSHATAPVIGKQSAGSPVTLNATLADFFISTENILGYDGSEVVKWRAFNPAQSFSSLERIYANGRNFDANIVNYANANSQSLPPMIPVSGTNYSISASNPGFSIVNSLYADWDFGNAANMFTTATNGTTPGATHVSATGDPIAFVHSATEYTASPWNTSLVGGPPRALYGGNAFDSQTGTTTCPQYVKSSDMIAGWSQTQFSTPYSIPAIANPSGLDAAFFNGNPATQGNSISFTGGVTYENALGMNEAIPYGDFTLFVVYACLSVGDCHLMSGATGYATGSNVYIGTPANTYPVAPADGGCSVCHSQNGNAVNSYPGHGNAAAGYAATWNILELVRQGPKSMLLMNGNVGLVTSLSSTTNIGYSCIQNLCGNNVFSVIGRPAAPGAASLPGTVDYYGYVGRVVVFSSALSANVRRRIRKYLADQRGISYSPVTFASGTGSGPYINGNYIWGNNGVGSNTITSKGLNVNS